MTTKPIELNKDSRQQAIASIQRYFKAYMEEPIGNVGASGLLGFFLEEIGPSIYNQAILDAQEHMQERMTQLDYEMQQDEFQYWSKYERATKKR